MTTKAASTAAELRRLIAEASKELVKLEEPLSDEYGDGDVITYKRQFPSREQFYTYVALKIGDTAPNPNRPWWVSGETPRWQSWESLYKLLTSEYTWDVYFVSEWTELTFP